MVLKNFFEQEKNAQISMRSTGTVQNVCINTLKKFDKFYSEKCSLYSLTDLSFEKKTVNSISKLNQKIFNY